MSFPTDLIGDALTGLLHVPETVEARRAKRKHTSSTTSTETKKAASSSGTEAPASLPPSKKPKTAARVITIRVKGPVKGELTTKEYEEKLKRATIVRKTAAALSGTTVHGIAKTADAIANELTTVYGPDFQKQQRQLRRIISNLQRSEELRHKLLSGDMSARDLARAKANQLCPPAKRTRYCGGGEGVYGFHD